MRKSPDPVLLEIVRNALGAITDEMGAALMRTGFSPNIKERRDYSCALFDRNGRDIAQGDHMPVHLGSMPAAVASAMSDCPMGRGDVVVSNDPYRGGTHLPDITLIAPVFLHGSDTPDYYVASRAHHADVGGATPGSMGLATEIVSEGLRIPPVRLVRKGVPVVDLLRVLAANVRSPQERRGDLDAQMSSLHVGATRLRETADRFGRDTLSLYCDALLDYSERMTRSALRRLTPGSYSFVDALDGSISICVSVRVIRGGRVRFDFSESADQVEAPLNAPRAVTLSAVAYVMRCLAGSQAPWNAGALRPVEVITRPGSVLDARPPSPVAGGNVETSQRVVDTILGALSAALPEEIPAASQGTMNNLCLGGIGEDGEQWAYYETVAGGAGAGPRGSGEHGIHTHMTNSRNTPIEALEHSLPLRVREYRLRSQSGGRGRHRGGSGVVRTIESLAEARLTLLSDRRTTRPYGLAGGGAGVCGEASVERVDGSVTRLEGKSEAKLAPGESIRIETPGGGGWGAGASSDSTETVSQSELDLAEIELHREELGPICGVDEAGRGPLAGPVVVAAVVLSPLRRVAGVRDSKKLTPASREALALEIRATALKYAVIVVDHEEVDRLNILAATLEGMRRAVESLDLRPALVLVDGNRLPEVDAEEGVRWRAVVKGDDRFASIAAASILAKVERDRIMVQLDLRYPGYGFAAHKGYPTVQHRRALVAMGPCPVHRRSFRLDYRS